LTTFLLIRHGLTDAVDHRLAGIAPGTHLNEVGRAQVARLVEQLHHIALTAVVSSPLERTRETADPIGRDHGLDVETIPGFLEYDVGAWTGMPFVDLDANDAWHRFNAVRSVTRPERGELMLDVQHRSVNALLDLRSRYADAVVAVVSHGDVIRAMLLFALGMPFDFYDRLVILPARISIVELSAGAPRVLQVNGANASVIAEARESRILRSGSPQSPSAFRR
jgi:broad specificity phosphatase PhoE